jgi:hypothetical protein
MPSPGLGYVSKVTWTIGGLDTLTWMLPTCIVVRCTKSLELDGKIEGLLLLQQSL